MRQRTTYIITIICLLGLLTLGMAELLFAPHEQRASAQENRMLAAFPALTRESVLSGAFMTGFEDWLSDAFFGRDFAADVSGGVMDIFAAAEPETAAVVIDEATLFETTEEDAAMLEWVEEQAAQQPETSQTAQQRAQAGEAELWLIDAAGKKETALQFTAQEMSTIADMLNLYRAALPEDGTVHFINCPSAEYMYKIRHGSYTDWGSSVEDALQPAVVDGVYIYDETDLLRPYIGLEDLYPTNDHHWHSFSTSLTAAAMLRNQGICPTDYYEYRYTLSSKHGGTALGRDGLAYGRVSENDFRVLQPVSPVESYVITHLTQLRPSVFINTGEAGYRQFLGGTYGPWRLFVTGYNTGRAALVIGDSFSNAFIPYLTPYYDKIISTDLRDTKYDAAEAGANVKQYMDEYGVDDVYIITCTYTPLDGSMLQKRLAQFLYLDYGK